MQDPSGYFISLRHLFALLIVLGAMVALSYWAYKKLRR
jgi:hypothetical protein